ncbi:MAG: blue light receptor [Pycnora praestabilis]|nr:MAG: blue light receptor [Pycnora praestabilis]
MEEPDIGDMNGFFGRHYSADDLQRLAEMDVRGGGVMSMMGSDGMNPPGMIGGQSLDEIINQNNKELHRRRSVQQQFADRGHQDNDLRRASMMEFGSGGNGVMNGFQFDPSTTNDVMGAARGEGTMRRQSGSDSGRRPSAGEIALNTRFTNVNSGFNGMPPPSSFQSPSSYHSPLHPSNPINLDIAGTYPSTNMPMPLDFSPSSLEHASSSAVTPMSLYPHSFQPTLSNPNMHANFPVTLGPQDEDPGGGTADARNSTNEKAEQDVMDKLPNMQMSDRMQGVQKHLGQSSMGVQGTSPTPRLHGLPDFNAPMKSLQDPSFEPGLNPENSFFPTGDGVSPINAAKSERTPRPSQFRNAYSSSGFDMLGVLMRVATRPNPEISIGSVDMSCAFVVCDVAQHDLPIVYCSDIFERLTGYSKYEILGRNCRFLQAPDGKVQSGVKRKYVDDESVLYLKNMIAQRKEAQISLINYRKGGQPFMNLLTMIPVTWDTDEIKYFVGFQVDLVEQPNSVTNKNPDGSYAINYQRGILPRYVFQTPENSHTHVDMGQTIGRDDVSTVLSTIGTGESELSKRIWDKVLLENTDDVVHVLSLKGLFLYLSPSSRKVLEYDAAELVGTALSSVCHPSDIVPVTRELKDTSTGAAVNVVFRIRRKQSGYTWFESHGSLHTEQGKGRKCIILVGRERPVYALARNDIIAAGGIGENELWTKMSTSGMFLFVSSNVRTLLDRQPDDLVGTSVQALMRADSKLEFGRILELARTGKRAALKHEIQNKRGQVLQAHTTIYPGDAAVGQKPTFLVAQTRLLKLSRSLPAMSGSKTQTSPRTDHVSMGTTPPKIQSPGSSQQQVPGNTSKPLPEENNRLNELITTQPGGSGLPIGSQDDALASEDNVFDELKTTRSTSWQFELRQMEKRNRLLLEELQSLLSNKKKRKRRRGAGQMQKDCANCHTRVTPEWRRGPSGNRDLCNSCGLRWAKQNGRVSPRTSSQQSDGKSPAHSSPLSADILNNENNQASSSVPLVDKKSSRGTNAESHVAKTSRMEAGASQGFGGGIPAKIEEGEEPA